MNDAQLMDESKQYVESEEGSPKYIRKSQVKTTVGQRSLPLRAAAEEAYVWQNREDFNIGELNEVRGSRDI